MKKLILSSVLLAFTLAAATDVSGIWNGKGGQSSTKYGTIPLVVQLTLLQAGSNLSGTMKFGNNNPAPINAGSVSGNNVNFSATNNGKTATAALTLQSTGQLSGTITTSTGGVYKISLVKQ